MKEMFGRGFGFIMGLYTAFAVTQMIDDALPSKYKQFKKETKEEHAKEVNSEE